MYNGCTLFRRLGKIGGRVMSKGGASRDGEPVNGVAGLNSLRSLDASVGRNPDIPSDTSYDAWQRIVDTIKSY